MTYRSTPHTRFWLVLLAAVLALLAAFWSVGLAQAADVPAVEQAGSDAVDHGGPGNGDDDHDDYDVFAGVLTAFPAGGGPGDYTIGGDVYTADADTEFELEYGPLTMDGCVLVKVHEDTPTVAEKIRTVPMDKCGGDDDDDEDDDDVSFYGLLVSMPQGGTVGDWVVGDRTFTADANTTFDMDHGAFEVGGCVEVEYDSAAPTIATKIETESAYKCNGQDDDDDDGDPEWDGRLFGQISALPSDPNLVGTWTVGTFSFEVTADTELEDRDPSDDEVFEVGAFVKVKFVVENGVTTALEVELVYPCRDDDDDDDDWRGHMGHAWGTIEDTPDTGTVGTWLISGVEYQVTEQTRLKDRGTGFAPGTRVMVKFREAEDGSLVAWEIKATHRNGGVDPDESKFVGFVDEVPAGGTLLGNWQIGGEWFIADNRTVFKEDDGLLVDGAYVEVEYVIVNGQRFIKKLETEVAPDSGDDDFTGVIERGGDDADDDSLLIAVSATVDAETEVWRISGRDFLVTTATELNTNGGPLTVGSTVMVNSYTNAAGQQVATRVAGVTFSGFVFLPLAQAAD